jgi:hypothetical protein
VAAAPVAAGDLAKTARRAAANPPLVRRPLAAPWPAERLLYLGIRGWVSARRQGAAPGELVGGAIARRTSGRAAALFTAWIQAVEAGGLRPIEIQCADCGGVSQDEQRLVIACGGAPVAFDEAQALLEPLVRDAQAITVLGRALNFALAQAGWRLPCRLGPEPFAHTPTLH